jgi:hypothetical protein
VAAFIILVPQPVVGAIIVYTAGHMMVAGVELILSRLLNSRPWRKGFGVGGET